MKPIEFIQRFTQKVSALPLAMNVTNFPRVHLLSIVGLASALVIGSVAISSPSIEERTVQLVSLPIGQQSLKQDEITVKLAANLSNEKASPESSNASISIAGNTTESYTPENKSKITSQVSVDKVSVTETKDSTAPSVSPSIVTQSISALTNEPSSADPIALSTPKWHEETVKKGDTLSAVFNRAGLSDKQMYRFLSSSKPAKRLERIYPGQKIYFQTSNANLEGLRYQKNRLHTIEFTLNDDNKFSHSDTFIKPEEKTAYREGRIINSLFLAATDAGLSQGLIMELANIFAWDVDFALDIRTNDSFKVLYKEKFVNGEKVGTGTILAAEFTNQNTTYHAVRYVDKDGYASYYTPEGKSMKKAFLRSPVDFARISSHFNLKRKHPVLNRIRAHKGTDYAARTGTPIKAAGNGKVIFAGTKGGYGRTVIIRHGQTYQTLYAHMNKYGKGIRNGTKVKQGQIIGYVGQSGLATGPHLHYEFYKNGAVRNPVKVALPKADSIRKSLLANFKSQTQPLVAQMTNFNSKTQLASAKNATDTKTE